MSLILLIASIVTIVNSQITLKSCHTCARSSNYFCTDPKLFSNPWEVQCCYPGSQNANCKEKNDIKCSEQFSKSKSLFYSNCPEMTQQSCGLISNYDKLNLYTENDQKSFKFERLRYKNNYWKVPSYNTCSYTVMNPPGGYTGGKLYLKFTKMEPGITIYLSSIVDNAQGKILDQKISSSSIKTFQIEAGSKYLITAVPALNNYNTSFAFEYWNDGIKIENAPIFNSIAVFQTNLQGQVKDTIPIIYIYATAVGVGLMLCFTCICCICVRRAKKQELQPVVYIKEPPASAQSNRTRIGTSQSTRSLGKIAPEPVEMDFYGNAESARTDQPDYSITNEKLGVVKTKIQKQES